MYNAEELAYVGGDDVGGSWGREGLDNARNNCLAGNEINPLLCLMTAVRGLSPPPALWELPEVAMA